MRALLPIALLALVGLTAVNADARPGSRRSRTRVQPTPPPAAPKVNDALCRSKKSVLNAHQERLDQQQAQLVGADAEISRLERRLEQLRRHRQSLARAVSRGESRVKASQASYTNECTASETCGQYEELARRLEGEARPLEDQLTHVRDEVSAGQRDVGDLERRIQPLRQEYERKQCNNLVPGRTSQSTINRCTAIFSDWNRLQARLDRQNKRLPALESEYEQLLSRLEATERRANNYERYLASRCRSSQRLATVRRYKNVHKDARKVKKDIERLIKDVARLRGVSITVTAR